MKEKIVAFEEEVFNNLLDAFLEMKEEPTKEILKTLDEKMDEYLIARKMLKKIKNKQK